MGVWDNFELKVLIIVMTIIVLTMAAQGYSKTDFVKLVSNTDQCFSNCQTVYQVCNPTAVNYTVKNPNFFNLTFQEKGSVSTITGDYVTISKSIKNYELKINASVCKTVYGNPIVTWKTGTYANLSSYDYIELTENKSTVCSEDFVPFNPSNFTFGKNACVKIAVRGKKLINTSVDNILSFANYSFPEYAWWNASWSKCRTFSLNTTSYDSITRLNQPTEVNLTGLTFYGYGGDVRIVDAACSNGGNEVNYLMVSNGSNWANVLFEANGTPSTGINYSVYYDNPTNYLNASLPLDYYVQYSDEFNKGWLNTTYWSPSRSNITFFPDAVNVTCRYPTYLCSDEKGMTTVNNFTSNLFKMQTRMNVTSTGNPTWGWLLQHALAYASPYTALYFDKTNFLFRTFNNPTLRDLPLAAEDANYHIYWITSNGTNVTAWFDKVYANGFNTVNSYGFSKYGGNAGTGVADTAWDYIRFWNDKVNFYANELTATLYGEESSTVAVGVTLKINGTTSNWTGAIYPNATFNVTATANSTGVTVEIYENNSFVATGATLATYLKTLKAGTYYFQGRFNGTTGNVSAANSSVLWISILKGDCKPILELNQTQGDRTYYLNATVNATASKACSEGNMYLIYDGTLDQSGTTTPLTNISYHTSSALINFTFNYSGLDNYSDAVITWLADIIPTPTVVGMLVLTSENYFFIQGKKANLTVAATYLNGSLVTGASCNATIYWPNNSIYKTTPLVENTSGTYWFSTAYYTNGKYLFNASCSRSALNGSVSQYFDVSYSEATGFLGLIFIIIGCILIFFATKLASENFGFAIIIAGLIFFILGLLEFGQEDLALLNLFTGTAYGLFGLVFILVSFYLVETMLKVLKGIT